MNNVMYDMHKLMEIEEFESASVQGKMNEQNDYFKKLNEFVEEARNYLNSYNPDVVIYGEDTRKDFLTEVEKIKDKISYLGIKLNSTELENIVDAVNSNSSKELSDGIVKFNARTEILVSHIKKAQLEGAAPPMQPNSQEALIMAVDDSPLILNLLKEMLVGQYKLIAFTNGDEALRALENYTPQLFLCDIEMPGMDGHSLVKRIKAIERFKYTPILFLTSSTLRKHVISAVELGVRDYILKPVEKNSLLNKIKTNLNRENKRLS